MPAELLEPLVAAGLMATVRDGLLVVKPRERITDELRAYIREHRDELVDEVRGALSAAPAVPTQPAQPMTWPPPEPAWFAAWMREDDARRIATMAAAMRRKADSKRAHPRGNP